MKNITYSQVLRHYADEDRFTSAVATGTLLRIADLLDQMADAIDSGVGGDEALEAFIAPPGRG